MITGFSAPQTVICILCKAWVSVKKGDKTRFFHHVSNDHEVHHDFDLIFSFSKLNEQDKHTIQKNINDMIDQVKLLDTSNDDVVIPSTETNVNAPEIEVTDSELDELLLDDSTIDLTNANSVEEHTDEIVIGQADTNAQEDADELTSEIEREIKPGLRELRQVRQELDNLNFDTIARSRRGKRKKSQPAPLSEAQHQEENNEDNVSGAGDQAIEAPDEETPAAKMVKCSKCNKRMTRSNLSAHIKAVHKKRGGGGPKTRNQPIGCPLCDKELPKSNMDDHLKSVHGINIGFDQFMKQVQEQEEPPQHRPKMLKIEQTDRHSQDEVHTVVDKNPSLLDIINDIVRDKSVNQKLSKSQDSIISNESSLKSTNPSIHSNNPLPSTSQIHDTQDKPSNEATKNSSKQTNKNKNSSCQSEVDYKCGLCYQIFKQEDLLKNHIRDIHKNELDKLIKNLEPNFSWNECKVECPDCDLLFISKISSDYHQSVEHTTSCSECNMNFTTKKDLQAHMKKKHNA